MWPKGPFSGTHNPLVLGSTPRGPTSYIKHLRQSFGAGVLLSFSEHARSPFSRSSSASPLLATHTACGSLPPLSSPASVHSSLDCALQVSEWWRAVMALAGPTQMQRLCSGPIGPRRVPIPRQASRRLPRRAGPETGRCQARSRSACANHHPRRAWSRRRGYHP